MPLDVRLAPVATAQVEAIYKANLADPTGLPGAIWFWVESQIDLVLTRPTDAFASYTELEARKHDFTGIRRTKHRTAERGWRIVYIANRATNALRVLMLGERMKGQPHDVYEQLAAHLTAGDFDVSFAECGLVKPVGFQTIVASQLQAATISGGGDGTSGGPP